MGRIKGQSIVRREVNNRVDDGADREKERGMSPWSSKRGGRSKMSAGCAIPLCMFSLFFFSFFPLHLFILHTSLFSSSYFLNSPKAHPRIHTHNLLPTDTPTISQTHIQPCLSSPSISRREQSTSTPRPDVQSSSSASSVARSPPPSMPASLPPSITSIGKD